MYNATVTDHFENPRNAGEIAQADGVGKVGNPNCGDVMVLYIKVADDRLIDVKYKTFGCAAAIASCSKASEMLIGRTLAEAEALTRDEIAKALDGLPEHKIACSTIAPDAVKAAIADFRSRL